MKNLKFPTAHTILMAITGMVALMTWIIPAGKYDKLLFDDSAHAFILTKNEKKINLPARQETLDSLQVNIPLAKFEDGSIWKPINIPGSYQTVEAHPQGVGAFLLAPIKGIINAADLIFMVLLIGGLIGIMNITGAFEAGISFFARKLSGKEYLLIIIITALCAIGGTTYGMSEETIAFLPILIPVFLVAKYDTIIPVAATYLGTSIGYMCSVINPFSVIIASDTAGVDWTVGMYGRIFMFVAVTLIAVLYLLWYARRIKRDPEKSLVYQEVQQLSTLYVRKEDPHKKLTHRLKLIILIFTLTFGVMIFGVIALDWWFLEMSPVFMVGAVAIAIVARIKESVFVDYFIKGAADLLGVALIIGIARGISVLMDEGLISDTILYYASNATEGMNKGLFSNVLIFIYSGLAFFIPSSSGMAMLTMPIMAPLADTVNIGRETIVDAYLYGMGLFSFISPTGILLPSLAIVKVGYNKWIKFVLPLLAIVTVFTVIANTILVYL